MIRTTWPEGLWSYRDSSLPQSFTAAGSSLYRHKEAPGQGVGPPSWRPLWAHVSLSGLLYPPSLTDGTGRFGKVNGGGVKVKVALPPGTSPTSSVILPFQGPSGVQGRQRPSDASGWSLGLAPQWGHLGPGHL